MPIFSVIVPVYNVEKYLKKCIDSILNQTMRDFELILINDGSTDSSKEICYKYSKKDSRIIIIDKKNGGVSSTRNAGLDVAKGEFICFVDSDDYIENDYLEKLYNPNVDMVLCNANYINIQLNNKYVLSINKKGYFCVEDDIIEELIDSRYICSVWSKSYKKEIIDKNNIRFDTRISLGEDTMFVVDYLINIDQIYISDDIIYNYIDYGTESLSKFSKNKLILLEKSNEYIKNKLSNRYSVCNSHVFKKRLWNNYQWAIFETINSKKMNLVEKSQLLRYIFNNNNYIKLINEIDTFMKDDSKKIRRILATRNIYILF